MIVFFGHLGNGFHAFSECIYAAVSDKRGGGQILRGRTVLIAPTAARSAL